MAFIKITTTSRYYFHDLDVVISRFFVAGIDPDEMNYIMIQNEIFCDDLTPLEGYITSNHFALRTAHFDEEGFFHEGGVYVSDKGIKLMLQAAGFE